MKQRTVNVSDKLKITPTQAPSEVFDTSKIEDIPKLEVVKRYTELYSKHKDKVLGLVLSRIALDSVITSVEKSLAEYTNGAAINLQDAAMSEKISEMFDRSLLLYALESSLAEVIDDPETRREFVLKQSEKNDKMLAPPDTGEKQPIGKMYSRDPDKIKGVLDNIQKHLESRTGIRDDAPSPYGRDFKTEPDSGKIPVGNGTVTRKSRKTTRGRKTNGNR